MEFSQHSRVWIYQADKKLTDQGSATNTAATGSVYISWTAHNNQLKAKARSGITGFLS